MLHNAEKDKDSNANKDFDEFGNDKSSLERWLAL
jgi:hypothetical protein